MFDHETQKVLDVFSNRVLSRVISRCGTLELCKFEGDSHVVHFMYLHRMLCRYYPSHTTARI